MGARGPQHASIRLVSPSPPLWDSPPQLNGLQPPQVMWSIVFGLYIFPTAKDDGGRILFCGLYPCVVVVFKAPLHLLATNPIMDVTLPAFSQAAAAFPYRLLFPSFQSWTTAGLIWGVELVYKVIVHTAPMFIWYWKMREWVSRKLKLPAPEVRYPSLEPQISRQSAVFGFHQLQVVGLPHYPVCCVVGSLCCVISSLGCLIRSPECRSIFKHFAFLGGGGGGTHTETQRGRLRTACGQRRVDSKNRQTTPATTSTSLSRKQHTMPHSAQPQHTNYWAPRTRKRHQQEHWPQRPTESSNLTQHAKGRTGDCPGPRKGATNRRMSHRGGGGGGAYP